jgi:hypothetical protein
MKIIQRVNKEQHISLSSLEKEVIKKKKKSYVTLSSCLPEG